MSDNIFCTVNISPEANEQLRFWLDHLYSIAKQDFDVNTASVCRVLIRYGICKVRELEEEKGKTVAALAPLRGPRTFPLITTNREGLQVTMTLTPELVEDLTELSRLLYDSRVKRTGMVRAMLNFSLFNLRFEPLPEALAMFVSLLQEEFRSGRRRGRPGLGRERIPGLDF